MQQYGDYELEKELGRGATARVYLARHRQTHELVSLKIFHPKLFQEPLQLRRIQRELEVSTQLKHPNIVAVRAILNSMDPPALVMDFVDGENLEVFQSRLPYSLPEVSLLIVVEILKALEYAHTQGLVHRDLKPENVLVRKDGHIFVTDFGLAKWHDATLITKSNTIIGSLDYLSPEQAKGDRFTPLSDLFSVGSILYFLMTGTRPFARETPFGTLAAIKDEKVEVPQKRNPKISAELSRLLLKAMHPKPEERFQSALEFREAIRNFLDGIGLTETQFSLPEWIGDPTRASLQALNDCVEAIIGTSEKLLKENKRDALLENLAHLNLKAPQSPAIARLTQSYRNSRKRTREKILAVGTIGLLLGFLYCVNRNSVLRKVAPPIKVALPTENFGTVQFNVGPDIEVLWDDLPVDPTLPLTQQTLGDHDLTLKRPGQKAIQAKVRVKETELTVVNVK